MVLVTYLITFTVLLLEVLSLSRNAKTKKFILRPLLNEELLQCVLP